jgi:poly(A) polymerase
LLSFIKSYMTEPKKTFLALPPEAIDEDAVKVVKRLKSQQHDAYLVGGGVRDLFLGLIPKDFDVATSARPEEVKSIFRNCRLIGKRFRLAHVHFRENKVIEVSTFRKTPQDSDAEDLMIRDDNAFGNEAEDAMRRDFTINALFYDVDTQMIIDYVGGVEDLRARHIKTIGDPVTRFREDPVRILRGAKFAARLQMTFDPEVERAIALVAPDILRCAPPRILEEILRMLRGGFAEASFKLLYSMGILEVILPDIAHLLEQTHRETLITDPPESTKAVERSVPSSAEQLLLFLQKVDQYTRERGAALPDSVLLAALYWAPLEKADRAAQEKGRRMDPQVLIRQVAGATLERLSVPRKTRDRLVRILAAQHRLQQRRRGKNTRPEILSRRDFFPDAVLLLSLRSRVLSSVQLTEQSTYWGRFVHDPSRITSEEAQQPQLTSHQLPKTQQPRTRRGRRRGKNHGPHTPQPNGSTKE